MERFEITREEYEKRRNGPLTDYYVEEVPRYYLVKRPVTGSGKPKRTMRNSKTLMRLVTTKPLPELSDSERAAVEAVVRAKTAVATSKSLSRTIANARKITYSGGSTLVGQLLRKGALEIVND